MKEFIKFFVLGIKDKYCLDSYSLLLYVAVSFSFPEVYKTTTTIIIGLTLIHFFRLKRNKITQDYLKQTYFQLLIFSLLFFRSVHTIILIINLCIYISPFLHKKAKFKNKNLTFEKHVLTLFGLILLNYIIHVLNIKGIETFLYLLLYPILFICIKQQSFIISIYKSISIYITSVLVCVFYLILLNVFYNPVIVSTNTYFSEFLGIIHVYFGMYLGLGLCFILGFKATSKIFISKRMDYFIFIFLLIVLIYIGARISLLAVFLLSLLTIYKKIQLKPYKKIIILSFILISLLTVSYKMTPRVQRGLYSIEQIYESIQSNNKDDIIHNSWRNMYQRYLVTSYSLREIKENYLFGIGIKNVKKIVSNKVLEDGFIYFKPINTHNQYLHYLIGMGVPSFLFFIWMLVSFLKAMQYNTLSLYFLVFFITIMITESILVRIKGLSLFFLFYLTFSLINGKLITQKKIEQ